jgi:hypothetical protein
VDDRGDARALAISVTVCVLITVTICLRVLASTRVAVGRSFSGMDVSLDHIIGVFVQT